MSIYKGETSIAGIPTNLIDTVNNKLDATSELIENTRFDGQWIGSALQISSSTAAGTKTMNLTAYLPVDNYCYEVLVSAHAYGTSTAYSYLFSSIIPSSAVYYLYVGSSSPRSSNETIIPVGTDRKIYEHIIGDFESVDIRALGYRRIGTNE